MQLLNLYFVIYISQGLTPLLSSVELGGLALPPERLSRWTERTGENGLHEEEDERV